MNEDIDVLIVGGGPVGLAMACELHRHGLRPRLIEEKRERDQWSKAAAIQPRTLEVLRSMGVVEPILEAGQPVYGLNLFAKGERLAHVDIRIPGSPYPFILGLSQKRTEELLEAHLEAHGGTLERGTTLTELRPGESSVQVTLSKDDGTAEQLEVPWVVGCDGAHSFMRKALDISFEGTSFERTVIQADVHAEFPKDVDPHEALAFVSDAGPCGFLPLFADHRYRLIVLEPPEQYAEPTLENFQRHIDERASGFSIRLSDPAWMASFRFHGRIAERYRVGRCFLAGDSAHIHSPVGGQGMNLGIQDAFNLAWKLSMVHRGLARDRLLDSYEAERRAVGEQVVNTTDQATSRVMRAMTLRNPVAATLRTQIVSLVFNSGFLMDRIFATMGGVEVGYPRSPVVGEYHASMWSTEVGGDTATETPNLRGWVRFQSGPGPGQRVADIPLPDTHESILDLFATERHTLLLFDGAAATDEGYANLGAIGRDVRSKYGDVIDVIVVVPRSEHPSALDWSGTLMLDPEHELHDHFGARSESLYLIRPDGYVAYRSQPADAARLSAYLETLFL